MNVPSANRSKLGLLRAEYLREGVFTTFRQPPYWRELLDASPLFLVGGRGTGKTTSLRNISYEGQRRLFGDDPRLWEAVGVYWRIGTNAVAAFRGSRLVEEEWMRLFAHYVNLEICSRILQFVVWRDEELREPTSIDIEGLRAMTRSFGLGNPGSAVEALRFVFEGIAEFEDGLNRMSSKNDMPRTSVLGRPLDHLIDSLQPDVLFADQPLSICLDEFENLDDYQQRVINTLIKHVGDANYSFKIGVKPTGLRERRTLSDLEVISEPADFRSINIVDRLSSSFQEFARGICEDRLISEGFDLHDGGVETIFPAMSEEEEAVALGVIPRLKLSERDLIKAGVSKANLEWWRAQPLLGQFLVPYWSQSQGSDLRTTLEEAVSSPETWDERRRNYSHAMLFAINNNSGAVSKYYCGWRTLTRLADGNIRYLLQLINEAVRLQDEASSGINLGPVDFIHQTRAARVVGESAVFDLQSVSYMGRDLTAFVLNLGRIFNVMARDPHGHAPEVNQFRLIENLMGDRARQLDQLLLEAVTHAALNRFAGDKLARYSSETKAYNYALHPIFSAFLGFSSRSKRKMTLSASHALSLVSSDPRKAVAELLASTGREPAGDWVKQPTLFDET